MDSVARPDTTLPEALAERARGASRRRLVLDVALGALAAVAVAWWRPAGWVMVASAGLCFAAFGAWGLADRVLRVRADDRSLLPPPRRVPDGALVLARGAAAVVGTASAVVLVLALLGSSLGRIIS